MRGVLVWNWTASLVIRGDLQVIYLKKFLSTFLLILILKPKAVQLDELSLFATALAYELGPIKLAASTVDVLPFQPKMKIAKNYCKGHASIIHE